MRREERFAHDYGLKPVTRGKAMRAHVDDILGEVWGTGENDAIQFEL